MADNELCITIERFKCFTPDITISFPTPIGRNLSMVKMRNNTIYFDANELACILQYTNTEDMLSIIPDDYIRIIKESGIYSKRDKPIIELKAVQDYCIKQSPRSSDELELFNEWITTVRYSPTSLKTEYNPQDYTHIKIINKNNVTLCNVLFGLKSSILIAKYPDELYFKAKDVANILRYDYSNMLNLISNHDKAYYDDIVDDPNNITKFTMINDFALMKAIKNAKHYITGIYLLNMIYDVIK